LAALILGERLTPAIVIGGVAIVGAGVAVALRGAGGGASSVEEPAAAAAVPGS